MSRSEGFEVGGVKISFAKKPGRTHITRAAWVGAAAVATLAAAYVGIWGLPGGIKEVFSVTATQAKTNPGKVIGQIGTVSKPEEAPIVDTSPYRKEKLEAILTALESSKDYTNIFDQIRTIRILANPASRFDGVGSIQDVVKDLTPKTCVVNEDFTGMTISPRCGEQITEAIDIAAGMAHTNAAKQLLELAAQDKSRGDDIDDSGIIEAVAHLNFAGIQKLSYRDAAQILGYMNEIRDNRGGIFNSWTPYKLRQDVNERLVHIKEESRLASSGSLPVPVRHSPHPDGEAGAAAFARLTGH